jgi:leucyl-tRNA synthetase
VAADLAAAGTLTMGTLMKELMACDDIKKHGKQVSKFAQKVLKEMQRGAAIRLIDEYEYLCNAQNFLETEFATNVHIFTAEDDVPDPGGKKDRADPFRPAIYAE